MRSTDPTEPPPWKPLGEKVERKTPEPEKPKPRGEYGVVTGPNGKLKTTKNPNP